MSWSKQYDRCQNPDCKTPHAKHKGNGLCTNCHWKNRYHTKPGFQARVRDSAKKAYMDDPDRVIDRNRGWRAANRAVANAYGAKYKSKVRALTGKSHSCKWKIGAAVRVKNLSLTGVLASNCKKLHGERVFDVRLPDGAVMEEVPMKALKVLGFSIFEVAA